MKLYCWTIEPFLLLVLTMLMGLPSHVAAQEVTALQGYVHSTQHGQTQQPGGAYFFMVVADSSLAEGPLKQQLQNSLGTHLQRSGYAEQARQMQDADVVLVARLGVRADRPSIEAVLAGEADPDASLPTGVRYLQLEAYDLPEYMAFLRQHKGAAADINIQFQTWRTTVESRGLLADYERVLPALLQVATQRMGTEMASIERFVLSASGLQLDPA